MPKVIIYQKPTCTTCRKVYNALLEAGVDMESVNYFTNPLSAPTLRRLLRKMDMKPRQLLRTSEPIYKELGLASADLRDEEILSLMIQHPELLQRPIVEYGSKAILARPAERLKEIL